jgi:putative ABC transport system substrate-binding protein
MTAFMERLRELGYVDGQNVTIEERWAEDRYERLPALMAELVTHKVDVIVTRGTPAAMAAKNATSTIPIVVAAMGDPVGTGVVSSLARPGGNLTGLSLGFAEGMAGKWLELLQETVPRLSTIAVIANPRNPMVQAQMKELRAVAPARSVKLRFFDVHDPQALESAFAKAAQQARAVVLVPDPVFVAHPYKITALVSRYRLPTIYGLREFADAGGLIAYGPDRATMFRRAAEYVDKILKGAKPGELPIEQPTQYELIVNLKTAKALGITIPESILLRADEVIR